MEQIKIKIENCNNIVSGQINIEKNKLNIKFGINGTGKSTIARAIQYKLEDENKLDDLLPFNLKKENSENLEPTVEIDGDIKSVSIFNEEYVKQFLFQSDELVSNSFEIFIKTPKYIKTEKEIENQLENIKKVFVKNEELDQTISDFESLSNSFKTTQKGLSNASAISKGLKNGNKIENIPEHLKEYAPFIKDQNNCVNWLNWHIKGSVFSEGHENCPYCVSHNDSFTQEKIKSISDSYDKNVIKNFIVIIKAMESLGDYFSDDSKEMLNKILKAPVKPSPEQEIYIATVKGQIDSFLQRLKTLKSISFNNLKDDKKTEEKIQGFIIKIDELFDKLNSDTTRGIVDNINKSLEETLEKIGELKGNINKQKQEIQNSIKNNKNNINQFLKNAGYKYEVVIDDEDGEYKTKLQHIDFDENISGGEQYLSFGERNAFALVLFMYETLSKNPDLIILDDPISSFDKNKKYAILQMLFKNDISFKGETVLMLTHDIEPVLDTVKVLAHKFENQTNANFIQTKNGTLSEKEIKKEDIITFSEICENVIKNTGANQISKLIYLRRNFEILNDKGDEYQILSDLFHQRTKDEAKTNRTKQKEGLTDEDFKNSFANGENEIKKIISDFDYEKILEIIKDKKKLKEIYNSLENGYEKLQIFRIINETFDKITDVMQKFINETYHIENDFIHQLDPRKYDLIPEFIIKECDDYIN